MIRVSVQLRNGASQFRVAVQAESIERALEIVKRCNPGKDCQVAFPLDPETFITSWLTHALRVRTSAHDSPVETVVQAGVPSGPRLFFVPAIISGV